MRHARHPPTLPPTSLECPGDTAGFWLGRWQEDLRQSWNKMAKNKIWVGYLGRQDRHSDTYRFCWCMGGGGTNRRYRIGGRTNTPTHIYIHSGRDRLLSLFAKWFWSVRCYTAHCSLMLVTWVVSRRACNALVALSRCHVVTPFRPSRCPRRHGRDELGGGLLAPSRFAGHLGAASTPDDVTMCCQPCLWSP